MPWYYCFGFLAFLFKIGGCYLEHLRVGQIMHLEILMFDNCEITFLISYCSTFTGMNTSTSINSARIIRFYNLEELSERHKQQ